MSTTDKQSKSLDKNKVDSEKIPAGTGEMEGVGSATSDGGYRVISMQGSKKTGQASKIGIFLACLIFGLSQTGLTWVNKQIFLSHAEFSPVMLLMVQCWLNLVVSLVLMLIKEVRHSSFSSLRSSYGILVPEVSKVIQKFELGWSIGLAQTITVICGLFALKYSTIPV